MLYEATITLTGKSAHETLLIHTHSVSCVGDKTHFTPADRDSIRTLLNAGAEVDEHIYAIDTSICTFRPLPEKKPVAAT